MLARSEQLSVVRSKDHARAEHIERESIAWAVQAGFVDAASRKKLEAAQVGRLVARVFPEVPSELLRLAADWTLLFCALDDVLEDLDRGPEDLSAFVTHLIDVLRARSTARTDVLSEALLDLRARLAVVAGADVVDAFARDVEELLECVLWAEIHRRERRHLSVAEYTALRAITAGIKPYRAFGCMQVVTMARTSVETLDRLRDLETLAARIVGWSNDLFTYAKERAAGNSHNLVLLLTLGGTVPLDVAVERARRIHDRDLQRFTARARALRFRMDAAPGVGERIEFLERAIVGHAAWARETARYATHACEALD